MTQVNRKTKLATQPGRGIRKIIDLYHDLPDLLDKATKYANLLDSDVRGRHDSDEAELLGMAEEDVKKREKSKWVSHSP